jgi:hypothetical protein
MKAYTTASSKFDNLSVNKLSNNKIEKKSACVKWVDNMCKNLHISYSTDILKLLSLLTIISKVLKYKISEKDLIEILSVSKLESSLDTEIDNIIDEMTNIMLDIPCSNITHEYVLGICDLKSPLKLIKYMMAVFRLNISINTFSRNKAIFKSRREDSSMDNDELSIILNACERMSYYLTSIIRIEGKRKPSDNITQKSLSLKKTIHRDMGLYNISLNRLKQSLELQLSDVSPTEIYLYDLILSMKSFDINKYTLTDSEAVRNPLKKKISTSVTNYDGTSCILPSNPPKTVVRSAIVKIQSKYFDMSKYDFLQLATIGIERMLLNNLVISRRPIYSDVNNKSFGDVLVSNTQSRLYSKLDILHGETSISIDTNNPKMLILLTGHPEITPKLLYMQGVLSKKTYTIAEVKQYGCVLLYQLLLDRKISELADTKRYIDISSNKDLSMMYPYTNISCYRENCASYGKKILTHVGSSRNYTCSTCHIARMCTLCASNEHEGPCDADEDTQTESMLHRCPSCHIGLEKIDGCNHITCKCRTQFCWLCDTIFTQDPYPNTQASNVSVSMREHYTPNVRSSGTIRICRQFDDDE